MEKTLKRIVAMMKQHPEGIPLRQLAVLYSQTYHKNLTLSALGFSSMVELTTYLASHLVVEGELVFHKDHKSGESLTGAAGATGAGAAAAGAQTGEKPKATKECQWDEVKKKIVAMVEEHPKGVRMSKVSTTYSQKYHHNLAIASLGFKTISSLVSALEGDLIVEGKRVFHRRHCPQNRGVFEMSAKPANDTKHSSPQGTESPVDRKNPLPSFSVPQVDSSSHTLPSGSRPAESLEQEQLYQRIAEVIKKHHLVAPSMAKLKVYYSHHFGEELPFEQYLSLYNSLEGGQSAAEQNLPRQQNEQPAASPNLLSGADFPLLGTDTKATKNQSKVRDAAPRERSAAVFKEAYHAQVREVHRETLRAVEAMPDNKDFGIWRNRSQDPESLNLLMEDVIRDIAAEGELVTKEKVISRACQLCQIPSLEAVKIKPWSLQALKDLQYIMKEINMFIESSEAVMSICTLYELGQLLAGLKNKKRYEELNLGPLCKLPLIHRMFKIASDTKDDDIRQIETTDILKQLRIFRRKQMGVKIDLAEFMKHLADHYNCETPYELGIRIHSVGLPISTLNKVTRCEHTIMEQAKEVIQRELEEETQERLRKIKKSVLEPVHGAGPPSSSGNFDLRKKYVSMTASEVVMAVFTNAEGVFSSKMFKPIQSFLLQVTNDRLAKALFQLAICGGSLAVPQDLVPKDKTTRSTEPTKKEDKPATALPSEAEVKQFLKDNLLSQNSAVTLAHISSLERKLTKHFQVKDFLSLGQGNFLEFLVKHIQLLQDTLGSTLSLGSNSMVHVGGFRPTKQDVFEFIKQCGDNISTSPDDLSHVESALRAHYRVRDSRDLGFGSLQTLARLIQLQRGLAGGGLSLVYYESALFAKHDMLSADGGCEAVGRLGEMSKEQALASLLSCPLLEDLSDWSQWELIFKPLHGSLKDFVERNAGNTGLAALEVTSGLLLRITTHTGDKHFSSAAMTLDPVGTAGHLVSMVVADGIVNTPTALLANHMQSSLATAVAKEDLSKAEEDVSCYSAVATFILGCLTRIPTRNFKALLQQVFLEPFSRVLGQAKSKQVLITVAQSDPRYLNCLHRLGFLLGITDWVKDYHKKLTAPTIQNDSMHASPMEQAKSNLIDSESSSLSGLNTSEDEYAEENVPENSFPRHPRQSSTQVNGQREEDSEAEEEDEEEEEMMFELAPQTNGETSDTSGEAEVGQSSELSAINEGDLQSETTLDDSHRAVIEDIRKNEFGIGVELTAEGQKLMQVHQDRLGRSLDRLSTELYSKDTHFVLELIQNADDNSYPLEAGVVPALAVVVERDCITVLNNETGFQESNIRAICDVGRSTKGKHTYGYIGQKGIGFKSVFKVTDCPEIHSNGFHLFFDKTCGPMGYILPHWTEEERPLNPQLKDIHQHSWTTKICLPLRAESHQTRNLFHDVHPSLLLFLHRLRSITIYNQSEKHLVTMTRKDLSHNVVEVEHTDGTERWLVVKSTLQPKKLKEDVESTELALAFQLGADITGSDIVCQPQKQPVFAYLPLRSFGFRFIIQADFDIPSSREDVDRDSSWNQWLRSEIPQLFLQAMQVFMDHPEFRGLKGLCQFLQFAPLPDEVLDFFKPVASQIIQLLKGKAFLPTLSSDGQVVYKLPSQVAVCQDAVIQDVIGGAELEKHLSLSYLHPNLHPAPPTSLLSHLGVRYLRGSDVTTVTTAMAKELMRVEGIHSAAGLRQLARLLVCNYRALEHGYGEGDAILQTLKGLPIIPLADGRVVALSEEEVFFPIEEAKTKKNKSQAQTGPLSVLYKDVNVVQPSLLSCVEPLESQQVQELLRRLGVHELEPQELLEQHIYPSLKNSKWKSKPEAVVVSYLVFIKQHSSSSQEYSDLAVPVLTNRGLLCPGLDRVHYSEEYGNIKLAEKLPGYDWVLLSPCYVQADGDVAGWRELFSRLGVRDGLIIRKERQTLTAKQLASSPWSVESTMWHQNAGGDYVLDDYPCEEFHALATAKLPDAQLLEQRMVLLELLATNWDTGRCYSQYLSAQVIDSNGRHDRNTKSSFYHYLCRLEWMPAYRPLQGHGREIKFLLPNSVYLTSPEITSLLGTHVFYVDLEPSEFSRVLGMRQTISVDALITYLKEWCIKPEADDQEQRRPEEESVGAEFTSTVKHIHNVYTYLDKNCAHSSLKELFQHTPAVFVKQEGRHSDEWCSGRFYHLKEVCWSDPTKLFRRYKELTHNSDGDDLQPKLLDPFYSQLEGMKDFFTRTLSVDRSPNMKQYVSLLELICSSCPIPTAEVLQDVSVLYARLAHKCKIPSSGDHEDFPQSRLNTSYCSTLKGMVSDKRVFPTKENTWVSLARKPMIADSKELEKIFKPHRQVCLLYLPPAERLKPKIRASHSDERAFSERDRLTFMEICGIPLLSRCIKTEPQTENLRPCPPMQALVHSVIPYVQKFLYHHEELADIYQELIDENIGEKIKRLNFAQVGKLYIRYQLDVADDEDPVVEMEDVICLLRDKKELYIQKDYLSAKLDICRELVKMFCTQSSHRKELLNFLHGLITSLDDPAALKRFLHKEDIRELPPKEEQWEVPQPKIEMIYERAPSRSSSSFGPPEEPPHPAQEDGQQTLVSWPPKASILNTGGTRTADGGAVEAVIKMWPPPAGPTDRDPERDVSARGSLCSPQSPSSSSMSEANQLVRSTSSRPTDQLGSQRPISQPSQPNPSAAATDNPRPSGTERSHQSRTTQADREETPKEPRPAQSPPSEQQVDTVSDQPPPNSLSVPEAVVVSSTFQGAAETQRPPLNLDFPLWNKAQPSQATLEDMELTCQRPTTVVLSEDVGDVAAIGEWGEQLVNSFLCHWRDGSDPGRPLHVLWCNQSVETGQPYDFKLTFGAAEGQNSNAEVVFVEVKSTIKREKSFIQLSANELDFALKEKERYHVYRVYSAGDAQNVRLCRIRNLAQHLHTKDVSLYLFV
ncbi:uncharacterized protein ACBR49_018381 isoform 2-T3 [Aulostomus maculatus]